MNSEISLRAHELAEDIINSLSSELVSAVISEQSLKYFKVLLSFDAVQAHYQESLITKKRLYIVTILCVIIVICAQKQYTMYLPI